MKKNKLIIVCICILIVTFVALKIHSFYNNKLTSGSIINIYNQLPEEYCISEIKENTVSYEILRHTYMDIKDVMYNSDGTGTASVIVTAPITDKLIEESVEEAINTDGTFDERKANATEIMINKLENGDYQTTTTELLVTVQKENGRWVVDSSDELSNALSCGVFNIVEKYADEM